MKALLDRDALVFNPPMLGCVLFLSGFPGGGGRIYDRSPYGSHGTITGASWTRLPSGLWCLSFDATDDYVDFGSPKGFLASAITVFSLEAWLQTNSLSTRQGITSGTGERTLEWQHLNTGVFKIDGKTSGAAWDGITFNTGLGDTNWHHAAVTWSQSGTTARLYIDGVQKHTQTKTGDFAALNNLYIGYLNPVANTTWDGGIALLRIYNRTLSALEIQGHFNQEKHLFGVW